MRTALRWFCVLLVSAHLPSLARAQAAATPPPPPADSTGQAPPGATVLKAQTRLVLVDVVVKDRDGHPVRNLPRDSFRLSEDNTPQTVRSFEEVDAAPTASPFAARPPVLPPGVFTDYQPVTSSGALNILLVDALNTPTSDQAYLLDQLKRFLRTIPPGTHLAIFGLNSELSMLQGFTTDPAVLRLALDHKLRPTPSHLSDDPNGTNADQTSLTGEFTTLAGSMDDPAMAAGIIAAIQQMETRTKSMQDQIRIQLTLDAFEALGHYFAAFRGRKNLIWFSGSFPINILPDPTQPEATTFAPIQSNQDQFQDVVDLLTRAQVSVYPVDVGGVRNAPVFDAATAGPAYRGFSSTPISDRISSFSSAQTNAQSTMRALAQETGGQAFYNTNDLARAASAALEAGSHFYALSYAPANTHWNRAFRSIKVELTDDAAHRGYTLAYRRGYYANAPDHTVHGRTLPTDESHTQTSYVAASMSLGAPAPSELLFRAEVRPAATQTEATLAPDNRPGPDPASGPFRRLSVDFVAMPQDFALGENEAGIRSGQVEFLAYVLAANGKLEIRSSKALALNLPPQTFVALRRQGMRVHLEVSVPAKGTHFLRLAAHDLVSHKLGVVEIPVNSVLSLPPAPPAALGGMSSNPGLTKPVPDQIAALPALRPAARSRAAGAPAQ